MARALVKHLVVVVAAVIAIAAVKAQDVLEQPSAEGAALAEYRLGNQVAGQESVHRYLHNENYDKAQSKITLNYNYPATSNLPAGSYVISLMNLYVEAAAGALIEVYLTQGGIGERSISLQIVAENSKYLRYMIELYGKKQ